MGYIRHRFAVAITSDSKGEPFVQLRDRMEDKYKHLLIGPVDMINGYTTFFFAPDGSKVGWEDSDAAELYREEFLALASDIEWCSHAHFQLGGDDCTTNIIATTDEEVHVLGKNVEIDRPNREA